MISKQAVLEILYDMDISEKEYRRAVNATNALPSISDGWISDDYPQHENQVLIKDKSGNVHLGYCTTAMRVVDGLDIIWQVYGIGIMETDEVAGWQETPK